MVDTVPHVPERCMVGGGWSITGQPVILPLTLDQTSWLLDKEVPESLAGRVHTARLDNTWSDQPGVRVRLPFDAGNIRARITEFARGSEAARQYAAYFFIANGGTVPRARQVRELAFDLKADYAYYLKVQVSTDSVRTSEELAELMSSLISELLPEIMRCVPDWVEVQEGRYPTDNPRRQGQS
jgi:hypothetical protein